MYAFAVKLIHLIVGAREHTQVLKRGDYLEMAFNNIEDLEP